MVRKAKEKSGKSRKLVKASDQEEVSLKSIWGEVYARQRGLVAMMLVLVLICLALLIVTLFNLNMQNMQVIVGYSDVHGGYQKGSWLNMLAFALLAVMCGSLHNVLALKVFRKYGRDSAMVVVAASMLLVIGAFVVLFRVLGARG